MKPPVQQPPVAVLTGPVVEPLLPVVAPPKPTNLVDVGGRKDVALLLPLSGPTAPLGRDMLDAAQLSLIELGADDMVLTPKDTKGTADGAAAAARLAIAEGARLIVGPLTATEAEAVKPIAQAAHVNVLAFSSIASIAGDGLFVMGILPREELNRIAGYAHSTGIDHFAALVPNNTYGQLAAEQFGQAVAAAGGTLDDTEVYEPGGSDLKSVIRHMAANGKFTFTALLVPESGAKLKNTVAQLQLADVNQQKVRLLGTGIWDSPDLGSEPSLIGGWYAAPPPDARAGFQDRFRQAYGHAPQRLATLAYDAVGVAAVLDRTPGSEFSVAALTNPNGFAGADGIFRLRDDGTAERGLAVLQVEHSGTSVVSPAPESFGEAGQ
ncbi:MAG TPA: penicillin-binding protein activator [Aliidongia sp.]|uniref:penicillin-binding protein activator n=1 Tax=Aliidongia sp. TaxID=1914230 RepID=UPI002DDD97F7|nr:penicillin-binding protein activator [Aliidongia sp.]HEV2673703.1 penicillin-binding protein activator [Aliidongia sp.]